MNAPRLTKDTQPTLFGPHGEAWEHDIDGASARKRDDTPQPPRELTISSWIATLPIRPKVELGLRWRPGYVHRCDTARGSYEVLNSPLTGVIERTTQRALLLDVPARVKRRIAKIQALRGENWSGHYGETR